MDALALQYIACEPLGVCEDVLDERVDEMLDHGRALFERWLDLVVRTSSLNAVRLEA